MRLSHVKKRYGDTVALDDIDLTIEKGQITAVLGESGAGKTTLLNILARMTDFAGMVEGDEVCSYLFQEATLLPHLSAEGNLKLVLPKSEWPKIPSMLAEVGLSGLASRRPGALSGGERQRVAIARAFLYPHELLLMDEPFSSLDLALKASLISLVERLWKAKGSTIVFVTHDVHEAALLADRALVLKRGRITADLAIASPRPRDFFKHAEAEDLLTAALVGDLS